MAIPTANLIFNDLNFRLALAELEFIVDDSEASVLFADARQWETATALRDRCPSLRQLVWMDDGDSPDGSPTWDELAAHDWSPPPADLDADCVAAITYTGGTTGLPKGVMQTHGNLVVNAKHMLWANPLFESDRFLHLTPMFHSAGVANMYAQTLVAGTQITCPGFDPDLVGRMIERYRRLGLRARADDDQHVPQPSGYGASATCRRGDSASTPPRRSRWRSSSGRWTSCRAASRRATA